MSGFDSFTSLSFCFYDNYPYPFIRLVDPMHADSFFDPPTSLRKFAGTSSVFTHNSVLFSTMTAITFQLELCTFILHFLNSADCSTFFQSIVNAALPSNVVEFARKIIDIYPDTHRSGDSKTSADAAVAEMYETLQSARIQIPGSYYVIFHLE